MRARQHRMAGPGLARGKFRDEPLLARRIGRHHSDIARRRFIDQSFDQRSEAGIDDAGRVSKDC